MASAEAVRECAAIDTDRSSTLALLSDLNWRPTLVAAVAAAFLPFETRITDALWHLFDSDSWVVPQIAAILASIDPDFQLQARRRLEAHCPLDSSELRALTLATPEHQELVALDMDAAHSIAVNWGERFAQIRQQIQP